ncbi:riboflavin synthase [Iocasia frigidifontis]|uniref:riboflavin synthase n=1 Tax=Iocasia fonsfrigidae TaxID=2682810 RepID=UPI001E2D7D22|nr:riboflavin synthase [Iocasia fonsfrigidae]
MAIFKGGGILFTGIIQELGILQGSLRTENSYQLLIKAKRVLNNIKKGDSIAVNGVCLTVVDFTGESFTVDIMPETLRASNLGSLKQGSQLNLEQAVRADGFLGGHLLSGHIDGVGRVKQFTTEKNAVIIEIMVDSELTKFMVDKGSVGLNGVSLTIMKLRQDSIMVSLIPTTRQDTNLDNLKVGQLINIETDLIAKYVYKIMEKGKSEKTGSEIDKNFLRDNGFL